MYFGFVVWCCFHQSPAANVEEAILLIHVVYGTSNFVSLYEMFMKEFR